LLGGAKTALLGNALQQQFGPGLDWPFGAAIAVASLIIVLFGFWLFERIAGERELNIL
jgi:spermidine/putrescine transport system permease protein